ncbi:hypothetical protein D9619_005297 [Psilocybe cf. subviscida]|uniref:Uncharacterized protein n=1 Tax=Psilocybe cf. subviscida TaxID=2480587 RepID=A0A8H5BXV9_9AGAR|nr:hypothetical protein D9619_005297 [Psilocybe cf. subviscida]
MSASTPHSLNFSPAVQQTFNSTSKRNSAGSTQLPLPSGLNAPMSQRTPGGMVAVGNPGPSSPRAYPYRPSELSPTHTVHSSTHAGGIQPSAAFFRPSRPTHQPQYSRPSSPESIQDNNYQLGPISSHYDAEERRMAESIAGGNESEQEQQVIKRVKQSREPLLPGPGVPPVSRPSLSAPNAAPATRLVKHSLDRVLSISRGLSFDSMRRSSSTRPPGDNRYEPKASDEENGYSPTTYKHPAGRSLDVPRRRNSALGPPSSPSPDPSFIPTPPSLNPPLTAVPVTDPQTGKLVRKYQAHPSRNLFAFKGRMLTGGDTPWAFIATFLLILSIAGVWFGTTAVWWWHNESPAVAAVGAYLALMVISLMLATASTDPGILPRNLDPDPPYPATSPSDGGVRAPMPRDLKVRSDV